MPAARKPLDMVAVVRIGAQTVSVPAECVAQAVPRPERWLQVPRLRSGPVEGVLVHGGQLVPVVRISSWLAEPESPENGGSSPAADQRVLLLRDAASGGRVIGLLVDAILGIRRVRAGDVQRLFHDDDPTELFQSAVRAAGDGAGPSNLLEVERLMRLADVWCEPTQDEAGPGEPAPGPAGASAGPGETWATFRIGDVLIGLRAGDVAELVRTPSVERLVASTNGSQGICRWRGRTVPIVDLTPSLAAHADPVAPGWLCIVGRADLCIGLLVHEVRALRQVDSTSLRAGGTPAEPDAIVLGAVVDGAHGTLHLIETEGLFARFPEAAISVLREPRAATRPRAAVGDAAQGFMIFEAGAKLASPIDAVEEVIGLPADLLARLDSHLPTTVEWRGHPVPIVDLRRRPGIRMTEPPRQLAIVVQPGRTTAVAIGGVRAMLPPWRVTRSRTASGSFDVVTTEEADVRASYNVLDLAQV